MTWESVRATIGVGISALLVVEALTVLYECMRAVMSIGGSCGSSENMADSLERLDRLHRSGGLDDLEYAKAKDKVIRGEQA